MSVVDIAKKVAGALNPIEIIKQVMPIAGAALAGPAGSVAVKAAKQFLGKKLLDDAGAKLDDIGKLIKSASPEELRKLRNLDIEFQKFCIKANVDIQEILAGDRANARALQVAALKQPDVLAKRFIYYFAAAWSIFCFIYIPTITFLSIPVANQRFADTILGFLLGTILASMFGFFYGNSVGSVDKSDNTSNR